MNWLNKTHSIIFPCKQWNFISYSTCRMWMNTQAYKHWRYFQGYTSSLVFVQPWYVNVCMTIVLLNTQRITWIQTQRPLRYTNTHNCRTRIQKPHNLIIHTQTYRIAGIFRGYKFSRMDHYKRFRGFYFRGLSFQPFGACAQSTCSCTSTPLASNPGLAPLHTVSLESRPSL